MIAGEEIRAKVALRCFIRLNGSGHFIASGVTRELTRESLIVDTSSTASSDWLTADACVFIAVDLPVSGRYEPRVLECAAIISRTSVLGSGVRVVAKVHRMTVINRNPETHLRSRAATYPHAAKSISAVERPQNDDPVIPRNHPADLNIHSDQTGEQQMSFLKKFFVEEDGQGLVEYGLIVAGIAAVGAVALAAYTGTLSAAFTALAASVSGVVK
jgi:Flp pilus assembly pilin Flp